MTPVRFRPGDKLSAHVLNDMMRMNRRMQNLVGGKGVNVSFNAGGGVVMARPVPLKKKAFVSVSGFYPAIITRFSTDDTHFWGYLLDTKHVPLKDKEGNTLPEIEIYCRIYPLTEIWKCIPSQIPDDDIVVHKKLVWNDTEKKNIIQWWSIDAYSPIGCTGGTGGT